jgi:cytochrome c-type biogenesis protein CcmH
MRPSSFVLLAGFALATIPVVPDAAAPVPIPRFKPSLDELSNFAEMLPAAREAMLRGLAIRLESRLGEDPNDVEGWLRLAQTRTALAERAKAVAAFERALDLAPTSPSVLRAYATALLEPSPSGDQGDQEPVVTVEALALYRRLSLVDPRNPEPHWYSGLFAHQNGDPARAGAHWANALRLVRPGSPDATLMLQRIERLRGASLAPSPAITDF